MMNDEENQEDDESGLTEEQKNRISLKFRAAKALLARKRPRHSFDTSARFPSK